MKANPGTIFIACHLANCCSDLNKLGRLFDKYPNLYADIAARYIASQQATAQPPPVPGQQG